jgi:hypothetical protein
MIVSYILTEPDVSPAMNCLEAAKKAISRGTLTMQ